MEQRSRRDESDDSPIYSRLFIVCEKHVKEDDLQKAFTKFGTIEEIRVPRDHKTGSSKGVAYIKFSKTSEAARALEEMNNKGLPQTSRPLKVKVACNRSEVQTDDDDRQKRLFITIPQVATEDDIQAGFKNFGHIQDIQIQRDRMTGQSKGFAYVKFKNFSEAAKAYEECDRKYRAIFAIPKGVRKPETAFVSNVQSLVESSSNRTSLLSIMNVRPGSYTRVKFLCCPQLNRRNVETLFDIVPGMVKFHHHVDLLQNVGTGTATYSNPICAAYAVEKLNLFEYPPGLQVFVKPDNSNLDPQERQFMKIPQVVNNLEKAIKSAKNSAAPDFAQLAEAIAEASKLIKTATAGVTHDNIPDSNDLNYCSVRLPPPKPLADIDMSVVKRCFLVCKPQPPPMTALRDIFCRFGDLINVYTLPNKTIGYACYASAQAADNAIKTLHGAEICGVRMKVIEAEEEAPTKRARYND